MATETSAAQLGMIHPVRRHRQPASRQLVMASVADIAAGDVGRRLAAGDDAVMASDTVIGKARVIHLRPQPLGSTVAGVAFRAGRHVGCALAGGDHIVMATAADPNDLTMVHGAGRHWCPGGESGDMAVFTQVSGIDVSGGSGRGPDAGGVTLHAIIGNGQHAVHQFGRQPGVNVMAQIAGLGGRYMIRRLGRRRGQCRDRDHAMTVVAETVEHLRVIRQPGQRRPGRWAGGMTGFTQIGGARMGALLAGGDGIVMATDATAHHLRMVDRRRGHWFPGYRPLRMTRIAHIGSGDMRGRLATGLHIIVTAHASADDLGMIHPVGCYRLPGQRRLVMATVAGIRSRDVVPRLAAGRGAVMAGYAIAGETGVIHGGNGYPGGDTVANIALQRGLNMGQTLAGCHHIVMATAASTDHLAVIHGRRR